MNNANLTNTFETSEFGTGVTQTFTSPTNWLPGDTTTANFTAVNNKETEVAVKITLTEQWKAANNSILSGWITSSGNPSAHTNNEATDEKSLETALQILAKPSDKPQFLEVFLDAADDAAVLNQVFRTVNEELIPEDTSFEHQAKKMAKKILSEEQIQKLRKVIKK